MKQSESKAQATIKDFRELFEGRGAPAEIDEIFELTEPNRAPSPRLFELLKKLMGNPAMEEYVNETWPGGDC